jgi:hypothetical protein
VRSPVAARAAAQPGTLIADPTLPAGVVAIDLVPACEALPLTAPAGVRTGARRAAWEVGASARLEGLGGDARHDVVITGPVLTQAASFVAPAGPHGARMAVRAIPIGVRRTDDARPLDRSRRRGFDPRLSGEARPEGAWRST